ncbi:hypothetical protein WAI453_005316 [Rhynchosporium graminicola]
MTSLHIFTSSHLHIFTSSSRIRNPESIVQSPHTVHSPPPFIHSPTLVQSLTRSLTHSLTPSPSRPRVCPGQSSSTQPNQPTLPTHFPPLTPSIFLTHLARSLTYSICRLSAFGRPSTSSPPRPVFPLTTYADHRPPTSAAVRHYPQVKSEAHKRVRYLSPNALNCPHQVLLTLHYSATRLHDYTTALLYTLARARTPTCFIVRASSIAVRAFPSRITYISPSKLDRQCASEQTTESTSSQLVTNSLQKYRSCKSQFHAEGSKNTTRDDDNNVDSFNPFTEAALSKLLGVSAKTSPSSMDRGSTQYTQSDHASAAHYTPQVRSNYSAAATPTSEFGAYPASARSGSFPEHIHRQYHPPSNHSGSSGGGMAQPTNPSIAASSPSYPPQHGGPYSPYPPGTEMQHGYQQHAAGGPMYAQPRPDWAGYAGGQQHPMHGGYPVSGAQTPTSAAPAGARPGQHGLAQVYSFVPIPGAQQHKRPRRRYEEIERMYKCGWNGCEKAYGTLNHLNAHVTMQSHGQKRTPEEASMGRPKLWDSPCRSVQLPPIAYQPGAQVQAQYQGAPSGGVQQIQSYAGDSHLQYSGYPASPYGAPNHMYNHNPNPATKYEH